MTEGVLYIASGEKYITDACKSASSLKKVTPDIPITIFASEAVESSCFDETVVLKEPQYGYIDKVSYMYSSPYDCTLFLDTDTYIYSNISELFTLLERFDIAAAHASNRASRSSKYGIDGVPQCFVEMNTGVVLFKKSSRVGNFFSNWLRLYKRDIEYYSKWLRLNKIEIDTGMKPPHDQPAFREALYKTNLRVATLSPEYNCRFNFPVFVSGVVKILHGHHLDLPTVARLINERTERRVFFPVEWD